MPMVLVAIGSATILTTAYLASRDNSVYIGENVARTSAARWSALAGLEVGETILQTEKDWRTAHDQGVLLDDFPMGAATIDLVLTDLATGLPPTASTSDLELVCTATIDGVRQTGTAVASVGTATGGAVTGADVDLSEFAVFVTEQIKTQEWATITRWPAAPLSGEGRPLLVGLRATAAGTVDIDDDSALIDGKAYHGPGASNSLVTNVAGPPVVTVELPATMPFPDPPDPGAPLPSGGAKKPSHSTNGGSTTINGNQHWDTLEVRNGTMELDGDMTVIVDDALVVRDAKLIIDGSVTIIVFGNPEVRDGGIELRPGAELDFFIGEQLSVRDGYIGDLRPDFTVDASGNASYTDTSRIRLHSIEAIQTPNFPITNHNWVLKFNSVVKAQMYAPTRKVKIESTSALYGRVAAYKVQLNGQGSIFYDHSLDDGNGFANTDGHIYESNGSMNGTVLGLASLDPADIQAAADAMSEQLWAHGVSYGTPSVAVAVSGPAVAPGDPTPRPVDVDYELKSFGSAVRDWEN